MIILGLDIATKTGYAVYDTKEPLCAIRTGSFVAKGDSLEEKSADIAVKFLALLNSIDKHRLLVAIEQPIRAVVKYGGNRISPASVSTLNSLTGAICGVCGVNGVKIKTIPVNTWRKAYFGFAVKKGWGRDDYKKHSLYLCGLEGIAVKSNDAADAVGVAFCAAKRLKG